MTTISDSSGLRFGSPELQLPDALRAPLHAHLNHLRAHYQRRDWGQRVGFGTRPAVVAIDLATFWLDSQHQIGSNLDVVVEEACRVLTAARAASVPVFFTTFAYDPAEPLSPHDRKLPMNLPHDAASLFELDPRLERRPTEKIIRKRYASAFKGTNFHEILTGMGIDTLIVTGVSTSHCVYATCRDATDSFRVIVPREAIGERCELFHEVNLLDIEIDLADVLSVEEVTKYFESLPSVR